MDKYDVYDMACIIKDVMEENKYLQEENKRLQGIVNDYDEWVRKMNGQHMDNIGSILKTLINQ